MHSRCWVAFGVDAKVLTNTLISILFPLLRTSSPHSPRSFISTSLIQNWTTISTGSYKASTLSILVYLLSLPIYRNLYPYCTLHPYSWYSWASPPSCIGFIVCPPISLAFLWSPSGMIRTVFSSPKTSLTHSWTAILSLSSIHFLQSNKRLSTFALVAAFLLQCPCLTSVGVCFPPLGSPFPYCPYAAAVKLR